MVKDIRDGPADQYWDRLRTMMGSEGLITYWYLGRAFNQLEDPDTMRLRADMRNAQGGIMAAPLAIAAPETGGWRDRSVVPAPVAYSLHVLDSATDIEVIRVERTTVRQGRKMAFSRSEVTDASNPRRVVAITTGIGISLGAAPPGFRPIDLPPEMPPDVDMPPLHTIFGATRDPEGWRLPRLDSKQASTSASLHIGPIHVAFEAAAMEVATVEVGSDRLQVEDWDVHFVAPGTVGPFLVSAEARSGVEGRVAVRLSLVDEGRDGAVITSGAAAFRTSP